MLWAKLSDWQWEGGPGWSSARLGGIQLRDPVLGPQAGQLLDTKPGQHVYTRQVQPQLLLCVVLTVEVVVGEGGVTVEQSVGEVWLHLYPVTVARLLDWGAAVGPPSRAASTASVCSEENSEEVGCICPIYCFALFAGGRGSGRCGQ